MTTRIIVSNKAALLTQYGLYGQSMIENAVFRLMAADSDRDVETELFYLDQLSGDFAVTNSKDRKQNKEAVDWILRNPKDSILILGGAQIVPYEEFYSPKQRKSGSLMIIQGATRLLDVAGSSNPNVLITQIDLAANYVAAQEQRSDVGLRLR